MSKINYFISGRVATFFKGTEVVQLHAAVHPSEYHHALELATAGDVEGAYYIAKHPEKTRSGRAAGLVLAEWGITVDDEDGHGIAIRDDLKEALPPSLYDRLVTAAERGQEERVSSIMAFIAKTLDHPSVNTRRSILRFIAEKNLPITDDGQFIAYKALGAGFYDLYSGTVHQPPGAVIREESTDWNGETSCAAGLHFGTPDYPWFREHERAVHRVLVSVDPRNVAAISANKGRCSEYTVVAALHSGQDHTVPNLLNGLGVVQINDLVNGVNAVDIVKLQRAIAESREYNLKSTEDVALVPVKVEMFRWYVEFSAKGVRPTYIGRHATREQARKYSAAVKELLNSSFATLYLEPKLRVVDIYALK